MGSLNVSAVSASNVNVGAGPSGLQSVGQRPLLGGSGHPRSRDPSPATSNSDAEEPRGKIKSKTGRKRDRTEGEWQQNIAKKEKEPGA